MIASVTGAPETAATTPASMSGHTCPECGARFPVVTFRQIFCCEAHQGIWKARQRKRGYLFFPFAFAARVTRGGTRGDMATGHQAQVDQDLLIQRFRDEDAAAGRMGTVEYLALRERLGFQRP